MHNSLSRIEREYFLRALKDELPTLTLFFNNNSYTITDYQFNDNTLAWEADKTPLHPEASVVQILFMHKNHAMRFTTTLIRDGFRVSCRIPQDIYPEEVVGELVLDHVIIPSSTGFFTAVFPLKSCVALITSKTQLDKNSEKIASLRKKIGFSKQDTPAVIQLVSYLQGIGNGSILLPNEKDTGHIIHCDHRSIVITFPVHIIAKYMPGESFPVRIVFKKRNIELAVYCTGTISITEGFGVIAMTYTAAQEEDKRFLYERCYNKKYIEIE